MARLHQLLPVRRSIQETTAKALREAQQGLAHRDWLEGLSRTFQPRTEGDPARSPEVKIAQLNAADVLALVQENLVQLLDITATTELGNTTAKADVKIDGNVLIHQAPVGLLMFLEGRIAEWEKLVEGLPTLDPAMNWHRDETTAGMWKSDPQGQESTRKITKPVVMYPHSEHHPAQVKEVSEDVITGTWTTVKFSGALPADRVRAIQDRLVQLRQAVLHAREEANSVEAPQQHVGRAVMGFVFAPLS